MSRLVLLLLLILVIGSSNRSWAGTPVVQGFGDVPYATGFSIPTAIAFLPDGRLLVTEKGGALDLVPASGGTGSTLITLGVCTDDDMGLLGVAVDPAFATNGFIYLYRTDNSGGCDPSLNRSNQVVRVTMAADGTVASDSLSVLLTGIQTYDPLSGHGQGDHDGGGLRIGPDGDLYVGVGDEGAGDQQLPGQATNAFAQDLDSLNGKILRLSLPNGAVPPDNPFANQTGKRGEIFAYGFRNPFRFGFDSQTGNLWVGDVGDLTVEEVDIVVAGGNYAWPHCEGTQPPGCEQPGDIDPVLTYTHTADPFIGTCVIGGAFAPSGFGGGLDGQYFFGDFTDDGIFSVALNSQRTGVSGGVTSFVTDASGPTDVIFGPDGALYYVSIKAGEVRRVAFGSTTTTTIAGSISTSSITSTSTTTSITISTISTSTTTTSPTLPAPTTTSPPATSTTSTTTIPATCTTAADPEGVRCLVTDLRQALVEPPGPVCARKCKCTIAASLERSSQLMDGALSAPSRKKCAAKLGVLRAATAALGRQVKQLAKRRCIVPAARAQLIAGEVNDLAARVKTLAKSAVCTQKR